MTAQAPLLSVIVPAYNSEAYLDRALATLVDYDGELEVLIIDDGSTDRTAEMADEWAARHPGEVRAIHQENKGHGGAVNAGIAAATGGHVRVVDSDDWVDRSAMRTVLDLLRDERAAGRELDLLVTNYVYEKQGKTHKATVRYRNVLPQGRTIGWEDVRPCRYDQYILMHSLTMRTALVRESGLHLPEHTFYVDYIYSHAPLPWVRTLRYLDVDLYRYFIGRDDQSVNEPVMISRLDQLMRVNAVMVDSMPDRDAVPENLYRYMVHYLRINFVVCTIMAILSGSAEHLAMKDRMWADLKAKDPTAARAVEDDLLGRLIRRRSDRFLKTGYRIARTILGFN
ncbi:glycosyltransferase [Schaalia hyovaginalis]|uniref:glycosyltransferase n=1 Tax=Schaalia hyovaginalis TaxID=29316 RepID=UPI002A840F9F|nr:glycosyltransferase [Schaalia hyovaginalis]MDY4492661.1 glycosyltransferase [Schaalia hyovaginalis]